MRVLHPSTVATAWFIGRRLLLVALFVAAVAVGNSAPASAHATLLFTTPAANTATATAPKLVQLVFDEPVVARDSSVRITDESGTETAAGPARQVDPTTIRAAIPRTLPPGTYAVSWQAGADDGDLMTGAFDFVVGDVSTLSAGPATSNASDSSWVALARWAMWLGFALSFGGLVGERIIRRVGHLPARQAGRLIIPAGLVLGVVASALGLVFYATAGLPTDGLGRGIASSTPGRVLLVELSAFALALLGAATRGPAPWTTIVLLAVPVAEGFRAHPADNTMWGVLFTAVHLIAVAVWVGALFKVILVAKSLRAAGRPAGPVFADYSRWAVGLFALVVLSGVASGVALASPGEVASALGHTRWGWSMLLKLVMVVAVAGLAVAARRFVRRRRLQPTLRVARLEVFALVSVVGLSAFITTSTPPTGAETLQAAPPAVGPTVSAGTRAGEIAVGVVASDGQVVFRLTAPTDTAATTGTPTFDVDAAIAGAGSASQRPRRLTITSCGSGCFVAPTQLSAGANVISTRVSSDRWAGGSSAVVIDWPAESGDATLAKVVDAMQRTPTFTLFENVTSNTDQKQLPTDSFTLSGPEFLAAEPYGNGKAPEINTTVGRSGTTVTLAYPSEGIYVRLTLDSQNRIVRESLASAKHLVTRAFVYADS